MCRRAAEANAADPSPLACYLSQRRFSQRVAWPHRGSVRGRSLPARSLRAVVANGTLYARRAR